MGASDKEIPQSARRPKSPTRKAATPSNPKPKAVLANVPPKGELLERARLSASPPRNFQEMVKQAPHLALD